MSRTCSGEAETVASTVIAPALARTRRPGVLSDRRLLLASGRGGLPCHRGWAGVPLRSAPRLIGRGRLAARPFPDLLLRTDAPALLFPSHSVRRRARSACCPPAPVVARSEAAQADEDRRLRSLARASSPCNRPASSCWFCGTTHAQRLAAQSGLRRYAQRILHVPDRGGAARSEQSGGDTRGSYVFMIALRRCPRQSVGSSQLPLARVRQLNITTPRFSERRGGASPRTGPLAAPISRRLASSQTLGTSSEWKKSW